MGCPTYKARLSVVRKARLIEIFSLRHATCRGCSFVSKALNVQHVGATGAIVYDYRSDMENYLSMVQDETDRIVSIPAAFMTGKDG